MNKIGLICAFHNEIDFIPSCLVPWIEYRKNNPLLISCLDVSFQENGGGKSIDGSIELLEEYKKDNKIDFYEQLKDGLKEHEARNVALEWLLEQGVGLIVSVGIDEFFTIGEITKIFQYVEKEPFVAVFKIHYKNYVGDEKHYVNGFTPNRIWRVNYNKCKLKEFVWDDDQKYITKDGQEIIDRNLPTKLIPGIQIKHLSWLNGQRSKNKIIYQNIHFQTGCGYCWDEQTQSVKINYEFFKKTGQTPPEILEDFV